MTVWPSWLVLMLIVRRARFDSWGQNPKTKIFSDFIIKWRHNWRVNEPNKHSSVDVCQCIRGVSTPLKEREINIPSLIFICLHPKTFVSHLPWPTPSACRCTDNRDSFRDSFKGLVALKIIIDLPLGFPINNISSQTYKDPDETE